jgi:hypothetical protein
VIYNDVEADAASRPGGFMLSVRFGNQKYRITNDTLDEVFGVGHWRSLDRSLVNARIRELHRQGAVVIDGQRLRTASAVEETEQRLRTTDQRDEILRNGLLLLGTQLAELAGEIRSLRHALEFDAVAADAPLARAREHPPGEHEQSSSRANDDVWIPSQEP